MTLCLILYSSVTYFTSRIMQYSFTFLLDNHKWWRMVTSSHMTIMVSVCIVNDAFLLLLTSQTRGIRLYKLDCLHLEPGTADTLRCSPSHYDVNAVQLFIKHWFGCCSLLLGHLAREVSQGVSSLLSQGYMITLWETWLNTSCTIRNRKQKKAPHPKYHKNW
jgi:hypothetical protein